MSGPVELRVGQVWVPRRGYSSRRVTAIGCLPYAWSPVAVEWVNADDTHGARGEWRVEIRSFRAWIRRHNATCQEPGA